MPVVGTDVPCTDTPFDHACPTTFTAALKADLASVPEGRSTLRAAGSDDEQHRATSAPWDVLVDRTPPGRASNLTVGDVDAQGNVTASWDAAGDPALADGTPGSGTTTYAVRYAINGGDATDVGFTTQPAVTVHGVAPADYVTVEVSAVDAVGNTGAPVQLTDVAGPLPADDAGDESIDGQPGWNDEAAFDAMPEGAEVPTPPDPDVRFAPAPDQASSASPGGAQARASLPPLSNAGDHWIAHPDSSTWGTFRNKRQQFFVGSIKDGDSFFVYWQKPRGKNRFNSSWGYFDKDTASARGGACGWVKVGNIDPADGALNAPHCGKKYGTPPNMGYSISDVAGLINCNRCNQGTRVVLDENAQVYRNLTYANGQWDAVPQDLDAHLNPTSHNRRTDVLEANKDAFAWRYVTSDGRWLAGYNSFRLKGMNWGFIKLDHVRGDNDLCGNKTPVQPGGDHADWPKACY